MLAMIPRTCKYPSFYAVQKQFGVDTEHEFMALCELTTHGSWQPRYETLDRARSAAARHKENGIVVDLIMRVDQLGRERFSLVEEGRSNTEGWGTW